LALKNLYKTCFRDTLIFPKSVFSKAITAEKHLIGLR
jgi:hypothetical protein